MKITAVIPAYNEEPTIGEIVRTVRQVPAVSDVLVVSDGSTDGTAGAAGEAGARVLNLTANIGKGGAMMAGVKNTDADIVLFLDADLIGLRPEHVRNLLEPVITGRAEMTIGIFESGRLATDLAQFIAPYLSGQRAVRRSLLEKLPDLDMTRFGVEVALTKFVKTEGIPVEEVELKEMSHVMKEEKLGLVKGVMARMKMYWEIAKYVGRG
ncbi:MAG: glycosyltransferase family 2 protein [Bacillota bacterium]